MPEDTECLVHRLIGGDTEAVETILAAAPTSTSPVLLVAAALVSADQDRWLSRAAVHAATTRDRQLVAVAIAHFGADEDLLDALVRDHLADYPDSILAAWIASQHRPTGPPAPARDLTPTRTAQFFPSPHPPSTSGSHHV